MIDTVQAVIPQVSDAQVTAGKRSARVPWKAVKSSGEVKGYSVTAAPGGASCTTKVIAIR